MSTLLKLDPDLRVELPYGATGATGSYKWSDTYLDGKLVTGSSGALVASVPEATKLTAPRRAKITFPDKKDFEILGAQLGGVEPPFLTIRLFPTFPGLSGVIDRGDPIVIEGRPHEFPAGSGYWNLLDLGVSDGQPVVVTPERLRTLDELIARAQAATGPLTGTSAQRKALAAPLEIVEWRETDTHRALTYYPGTGWRDVYGNDPDATPPPPDTGVY